MEDSRAGIDRRRRGRGASTRTVIAFVTLVLLCSPEIADAGPPFDTNDPEPTPYRAVQIYGGATSDHGVFEANYGLAHKVEFAVNVLGEAGLAVKYRFLQESRVRPQVAFAPE